MTIWPALGHVNCTNLSTCTYETPTQVHFTVDIVRRGAEGGVERQVHRLAAALGTLRNVADEIVSSLLYLVARAQPIPLCEALTM